MKGCHYSKRYESHRSLRVEILKDCPLLKCTGYTREGVESNRLLLKRLFHSSLFLGCIGVSVNDLRIEEKKSLNCSYNE